MAATLHVLHACRQTPTATAAAAAPAPPARGHPATHHHRADSAGLVIALAYAATGVAYVATRIAASTSPDSLAEGPHWHAYSAAVLAAEVLSILSLCLSLFLSAAHIPAAPGRRSAPLPHAARARGAVLRRGYTVRVLVLCCGESGAPGRGSVAAVRRTIASVHAAGLPDGCAARVYVVDEEDDERMRGAVGGGEDGETATYVALPDKHKAARATVRAVAWFPGLTGCDGIASHWFWKHCGWFELLTLQQQKLAVAVPCIFSNA